MSHRDPASQSPPASEEERASPAEAAAPAAAPARSGQWQWEQAQDRYPVAQEHLMRVTETCQAALEGLQELHKVADEGSRKCRKALYVRTQDIIHNFPDIHTCVHAATVGLRGEAHETRLKEARSRLTLKKKATAATMATAATAIEAGSDTGEEEGTAQAEAQHYAAATV